MFGSKESKQEKKDQKVCEMMDNSALTPCPVLTVKSWRICSLMVVW